MKIKKYPQSCVMITKGKTKILVDPGKLKYDEKYFNEWKTATAIFVTHKHGDHCNNEVIAKLDLPIYSTDEVQKAYPELKINIIKQNDNFTIGNFKIEVVKAVHGFTPKMKGSNAEVFENIGFIFNDGNTKAYFTSDTICFNNDYKADYIIAPLSGNCVTMDSVGCALYAKMVGAKKLIIVHFDSYELPKDAETILKEQNIDCIIPKLESEIKLERS